VRCRTDGDFQSAHCSIDRLPAGKEKQIMKNTFIVGIALLVFGAAVLAYDHFSYTTTETVLQVGPVTATADRTHDVALPPILGWILIGGGAVVLAFAALSKKN
jgi:hypothetical protein